MARTMLPITGIDLNSIDLGFAAMIVAALIAAVTVLMVATVAVGVIGRFRRRRRIARREALAAHIRPLISEALDYAETDAATTLDDEVRALSPAAGETLDDLVIALVPKLRGTERALLVRLLRVRGTIVRLARDSRSSRSSRRLGAAEFLGAVDDGTNAGSLVVLLDDRDEAVRLAAVRALGRIGAASAVPALLTRLDEPVPGRRLPVHAVTMAILRCGSSAAEHLVVALQRGGGASRLAAAQILGWLGELGAAPELRTALGDHDPAVRVAAAEALGRVGVADATGDLTRLMATDCPVALRASAATALGRIGDPTAGEELARVVATDPDRRVAYAAARSLLLLGPLGVEALTGVIAVSAEAREVLDIRRARMGEPTGLDTTEVHA